MPIWVDGCCVMNSPIVESDRSGDPITFQTLSGEPGNTGCTTCVSIEPYMEDLDNHFQPNQPNDIADVTVARIVAENRTNHDNDDIVHIMNNRE